MIREVEDAERETRGAFDEIIDVRSPSEFAEDHVPGARNLPVLSDAERAEVGTLYVQQSKFLARRLGAAHVSRNIAGHLEDALSGRDGSYRPLVYCWRGGQRSAAMATVLSQVGWSVGLLRGGYRTYRRGVVEALYDSREPLNLVLLDGPTGSGKTEVLQHARARGLQAIDLEALANHRGSVFGDLPGAPQPTQKMFETRLAAALGSLDLAAPILVEAESSRIGDLRLPPRLWRAMTAAPLVELETSLDARVRRIVSTYGDRLARPREVEAVLNRLPRHHSHERRKAWIDAADAGDAASLAQALLSEHYDPAYRRQAATSPRLGKVALAGGSDGDIGAAAAAVADLISAAAQTATAWEG